MLKKKSFKFNNNVIEYFIIILIFLILILNINKGFSNLDEPFYLLWSLYPDEAKGGNSLFGFLLNSVFRFVDFEIIYVRGLGICALLLSAHFLIKECINLYNNFSNTKLVLTFCDQLLLLTGILLLYRNWLLTPSYNLLVVIGINFAVSFFFKILNKKKSYINFIFLSTSINIILFSKPTSLIIVLFLFPFLFICLSKRETILFFYKLIPCFFLSLFCLLFIYFNSFQEIYIFLKNGYNYGVSLGGGHQLFKIFDSYFNNIVEAILIFKVLSGILLLLIIYNFLNQRLKSFNFFFSLILIKIYLLVFYTDKFAIILPLFVFLFMLYEIKFIIKIKNYFQIYFLFFFILLVPLSFSFGSSNNFLKLFLFVSFYQIMILYIFNFFNINKFNIKLSKLFIGISILITLVIASHKTYDEKKFFLKKNKVNLLNNKYGIYIDDKKYSYLMKLQKIFLESGWKNGSYLIDLSSENALIYLLINAKFVGIPIMSNEFNNVEKVIRDVIDESNAPAIKKSWLITSDELPSNKELLLKSAKLNNNYHSPVAEISHFSKSKNFIIWSPINQ